MKKVILIIIGVLVVAAIIFANLRSEEDAVEVQTEEAFRADITQKVTGNGKIYPMTQVNISAKVAGEILQLNAQEGDSVKAGQILVRLDSQQYEAMLDRAKSTILGARADVKLAKSEFDRVKQLHEKNLVSSSELEVAEAKYDRALSQLSQAEASLKEAQDALDKTVLKAPMAGTIINKNKEKGEIALGSQFQEDIILVLADLSRMEARVEVNENDIINVSLNDSARVEIDAFPDTSFLGVVREIANSAQTKGAGTMEEVTNYQVKIELLEKLPSFRPGMSSIADIATETHKNVINIPIQSLTAREPRELKRGAEGESTPAEREAETIADKNQKGSQESDLVEVVFVNQDGIARVRPVKVGISDDNFYEVVEGIQAGEEVITGPFRILSRTLEDGEKIKVNNEEKSRIASQEES
ncbi:MAG: efflux RND transporter periplasmic adaptor subunit [Calditrichia bacterium]